MVVAEAMAGIALVQQAVSFIKGNIETARDISDLASGIDDLFRGTDEVNKKRHKAAGVGMGDQFGIKSVAQEIIDAKLAQEKMDEMRQLIDFRFGHGTWKSIVDERAKRIREAKEAAEEARKEKIRKQKELEDGLKTAAGILIGSLLIIGAFIGVIWMIMSGDASQ